MTSNTESQSTGSSSMKAQEAIRNLLDGNAPNGIQPKECGRYTELVQELYALYSTGGTPSVIDHIVEQAQKDDVLMALLSGGVFDDLLDSAYEVHGITDLGDGVKLMTWKKMRDRIGSVEWAWKPWIAKGFVTMIAGEPGAGKSMFALLGPVRSFTTGCPWPDGTLFDDEPGKCLWVETEAGQAMNLERVAKFGLDENNIVSLVLDEDTMDITIDQPQGLNAIKRAAAHEDIKVIALDSLSAGHSQTENSSDMMKVIRPFAQLARETNKPFLMIHHFNRSALSPGEVPTMRNVRGHSTILQAARTILTVDVPDKINHDEIKRVVMIKSNIAPNRPEPLIYKIGDSGIELTELPEIEDTIPLNQQGRAEHLLSAMLAGGPVPSTEVIDSLENAKLLDAAKKVKARMGITSVVINGVQHWQMEN